MKSRLLHLVISLSMLAPLAAWSQVSVSIAIDIAPPPLPVYEQPPIPAEGYIWTPGYWTWSAQDGDYYWVPGTWVLAPAVGYLWTPGYWGFEEGRYAWHRGYWADRVGFYGGVNYGYGYTGSGYQGGRWDHGVFNYNTNVNNVNTTVVHNVYNTTVVNNYNVTRVSFNGGPGGVAARPTPADLQLQAAKHVAPTSTQVQHERTALVTPSQRASVNHGAPQVAATPKPSAFAVPEVVHARNLPVATPPASSAAKLQQAPLAAQKAVPPPPHVAARPAAQPPAVPEPPAAHGAEQQTARTPTPVPRVPQGATDDRAVQGRPEAAAHPRPQPQPQAQPSPLHEQPAPRDVERQAARAVPHVQQGAAAEKLAQEKANAQPQHPQPQHPQQPHAQPHPQAGQGQPESQADTRRQERPHEEH